MSHTLAAVFDNRLDADNARTALINAGVDADAVQVSASAAPTMTTTPAEGAGMKHDESIGDTIKHFFANLFGDDDERVVYGEAVNRGNVVLTVQTATQDEVERAADIVEGFGPTDIDEYKSQWQASGWTGAESMGSPQLSASQQGSSLQSGSLQSSGLQGDRLLDTGLPGGSTRGAGMQDSSLQGSALQRGGLQSSSFEDDSLLNSGLDSGSVQSTGLQGDRLQRDRLQTDRLKSDGGALLQGGSQGLSDTGSLQRAEAEPQVIPAMQEELKAGQRVVQRGGVRIYQRPVGTPVQESVSPDGVASDDRIDDTDYRGHWDSNFANMGGTFDEYAPAYRYGASMRGSDSYRGRSWDESETTLRSNWESHNPTSAWGKFKDAVRHGWERMTS